MTDTDTLLQELTEAGARRAAAEKQLHAAHIEMRDAKLAAQALLKAGVEAGIPKARMLEPLQLRSRQSLYNLLDWKPGADR